MDGVDAQQPSSGYGPGLLSSQTARHEVQLQRLGRTTSGHRIRVGAVPAGSGLQLQEVPSL